MVNIERYLESVGKRFVKRAKKNLRNAKPYPKGGGNLEKSIKAIVKPTANGYSLQFLMADYGTFVDKGVKGAGGTIKNGKYEGTWGGKRFFINTKGKRQLSPYKYGTGTGAKGGLTRGIASFIRKKNLQPRDAQGKFLSPKGLNYLIRRNIWIRGIKGISFFQKPLGIAIQEIQDSGMFDAIELDILEGLTKIGWKKV